MKDEEKTTLEQVDMDDDDDSNKENCTTWDTVKIIAGLVFVALIIFATGSFIGSSMFRDRQRLNGEIVEGLIADYFDSADSAKLIARIKSFDAQVTEYSLYGNATVKICIDHTRSRCGNEVGESDCYLELDYDFTANAWQIIDYIWTHYGCACGCDECVQQCDQTGGVL